MGCVFPNWHADNGSRDGLPPFAGYVIVDDTHINSKLTNGKDVADNGGTLLASIAWKKQIEGQTLATADGFTPDQRFFVGMAQRPCDNEGPENERVSPITNPPSPGFASTHPQVSTIPQLHNAFD